MLTKLGEELCSLGIRKEATSAWKDRMNSLSDAEVTRLFDNQYIKSYVGPKEYAGLERCAEEYAASVGGVVEEAVDPDAKRMVSNKGGYVSMPLDVRYRKSDRSIGEFLKGIHYVKDSVTSAEKRLARARGQIANPELAHAAALAHERIELGELEKALERSGGQSIPKAVIRNSGATVGEHSTLGVLLTEANEVSKSPTGAFQRGHPITRLREETGEAQILRDAAGGIDIYRAGVSHKLRKDILKKLVASTAPAPQRNGNVPQTVESIYDTQRST